METQNTKRNKKILLAAFIVFVLMLVFVLYDFMRQTRAPWEKKETPPQNKTSIPYE